MAHRIAVCLVACPLVVSATLSGTAYGFRTSAKHAPVHNDLFTFPQFNVVLNNNNILLPDSANSDSDDVLYLPVSLPVGLEQKEDKMMKCTIPTFSNDTDSSSLDLNSDLSETIKSSLQLLKPLIGSQCYYYDNGYWTYELCYNRHVRQFHMIQNGGGQLLNDKEMEYFLGSYESIVVPSIGSGEEISDVSEQSNDLKTLDEKGTSIEVFNDGLKSYAYVKQRWSGGTICELTNKPRSVDLQFHCLPNHATHVSFFSEESTCNYLMIVNTPLLCKDPIFVPRIVQTLSLVTCDQLASPQSSISSGSSEEETIIDKPMMPARVIAARMRQLREMFSAKKTNEEEKLFAQEAVNELLRLEGKISGNGVSMDKILDRLKQVLGDNVEIVSSNFFAEVKETEEIDDEGNKKKVPTQKLRVNARINDE
ncbi:Protein OS-9 [Nowakowskiella sp. JEL0407]|nr:Protein OS-9 [Nowakowskiella sp. JEL0407]